MADAEDVRRAVEARVRGGYLIPTPNASAYKGGSAKDCGHDYIHFYLSRLYGGTAIPNPAFLEEMMGFPVGYTLEPFLENEELKQKDYDNSTGL